MVVFAGEEHRQPAEDVSDLANSRLFELLTSSRRALGSRRAAGERRRRGLRSRR